MVWCSNCAKNVPGVRPYDAQLCCDLCGKVLEFHNYSTEVTFVKNAAGQSQLSGNFVRTIQSEYGASRERLLEKAFDDMRQMKNALGIGDSDEIVHIAKRLYGMAVARNFTKGRRTEQVQASCLYFACREKMKPFLIIDFANYLNINVYELGAVYLQLCQVLYIADESNIQRQVDPSIFLPKFTDRLLPGGDKKVCSTARDILASMKRDWITTGRKPSGLCGAALYISALTHGFKFSKSDVVKIVHICEATLTKRLIEFENTDSGSLTIEDFMAKNKELQGASLLKHPSNVSKATGLNEVLCKHKDTGKPFAYGLCRSCYDEFMTISEGLEGGSDPPAFQIAERERMAKASAEENTSFERELDSPVMSGVGKEQSTEPESHGVSGAGPKRGADYEGDNKTTRLESASEASDESDNFSDIDDLEVDGYLHNEEEKHFKRIIWEEMNREYLEEQAAKEAAAAASREAFEANFKNCPEGLQAARELAAAAQANVAKYKREKQQKRAAEAKNSAPAETALEATRQMLTKKRLSSKINYDVLEKLFDDSADTENAKKKRNESHSDIDDKLPKSRKKEQASDDGFKKGDLDGEADCDYEGDAGEAYENELDYENADGTYDFDDDYGYDGF